MNEARKIVRPDELVEDFFFFLLLFISLSVDEVFFFICFLRR